jgi:lactoylglutathione lyase
MDFCWVTLRVNDLEKSLEFYHGILGLPVCSRFGGHGTEIAMLGEADKPKIELLQDGTHMETARGEGVSIGFTVDSLDKTMEYLGSKQVPVAKGPFAPSPHIRFLFVKDPDGYEVQLVENL